MNTYLINIFSIYLLEDEISKITNGKNNIITINYDESDIETVIEECSYFSLINEEKFVIVNNFKINASSKELENYLDNPNPNVTLILITSSIDKRSTIYKKIKAKGTIVEILELKQSELNTKISSYCKKNNISIDYNSINKLLEYNLNNYDLIINEINKLSIVSNEINVDLIEDYASKLSEEDIFGLCDAITSKNYPKTNKLLDDFIARKAEVIPLVSLLAGQYRIILATKEIKGSGEYIASLLNVHPYRVKLAIDKSHLYSKNELEDILLSLCDLDRDLKSLNANQYSLLKEFLIKII